jgi:hypothetical protein
VSSLPIGVSIYEISNLLSRHQIDQYLYFAASIFWRAAATAWAPRWRQFSLGPLYQEQFRRYLMDEADWPRNALLGVRVATGDLIDIMMDPSAGRSGAVRLYRFCIPGIFFSLLVGATVPRDHSDEYALNSSRGRFMWLCPVEYNHLFWQLRGAAHQALKNPRTLRPDTSRP